MVGFLFYNSIISRGKPAEKPKTVEKSTETEKTAKTTAEKKPATRRRGRPKKTQ